MMPVRPPKALKEPIPLETLDPSLRKDGHFAPPGSSIRPIDFQLRNIQTNQTHRIRETLYIGRSETQLREGIDLRITGISDISRVHCSLKVTDQGFLIKNETKESPLELCNVRIGEGKSLRPQKEKLIQCGCHIRLGEESYWVIERSHLVRPSKEREPPDPVVEMEWLKVPIYNVGEFDSLKECPNWIIFVEILMDISEEVDVAWKQLPCADTIQIIDNGETLCSFGPFSFQEMIEFDINKIQKLMRSQGQFFRIHLCDDDEALDCIYSYFLDKEAEDNIIREKIVKY